MLYNKVAQFLKNVLQIYAKARDGHPSIFLSSILYLNLNDKAGYVSSESDCRGSCRRFLAVMLGWQHIVLCWERRTCNMYICQKIKICNRTWVVNLVERMDGGMIITWSTMYEGIQIVATSLGKDFDLGFENIIFFYRYDFIIVLVVCSQFMLKFVVINMFLYWLF